MEEGGGSCMVASGVREIFICSVRINSTTYTTTLSQVLNLLVTKLQINNQDECYFQQDNAPCHTSELSCEWNANNHIKLLDWPS